VPYFGAPRDGIMRMIVVAAMLIATTTAAFAQSNNEDLEALRDKVREVSEALKKTQAELAAANSRLTETESALSKARDELAAATSNTVRGIKIKPLSSSRHANGTIYIGVSEVSDDLCDVSLVPPQTGLIPI